MATPNRLIYLFVFVKLTSNLRSSIPKRDSGPGAEHDARLALGSCGSQDFWGSSEWPASINEHGAINHIQSRGGELGHLGLIKSRYGHY